MGRPRISKPILKECRVCSKIKRGCDFDKRSGPTNALYSECKDCRREYQRQRRTRIRSDKATYFKWKVKRAAYLKQNYMTRRELGLLYNRYVPIRERYIAIVKTM